jgi:hypothetical protein
MGALSLNVIIITGNLYLLFHPGNTRTLQFCLVGRFAGFNCRKAGLATAEPSEILWLG